jgi:hypothetical protein
VGLDSVQIQMRMPLADQVGSVTEAHISAGGDCPGGTCDADESVTWSIGNLTADTSRMVTLPLKVVSNNPPAKPVAFRRWPPKGA